MLHYTQISPATISHSSESPSELGPLSFSRTASYTPTITFLSSKWGTTPLARSPAPLVNLMLHASHFNLGQSRHHRDAFCIHPHLAKCGRGSPVRGGLTKLAGAQPRRGRPLPASWNLQACAFISLLNTSLR